MADVRSFIAIGFPDTIRSALAAEVERLRHAASDVAWVAPDNLHVTLKFLGGVEEARLGVVREAIVRAAAVAEPFEIAVTSLGAFPSVERPRVVWAGLEAPPALPELAERVEASLEVLGFAREDRPFRAHVTLGRIRQPRRDPALTAALRVAGGRFFGRCHVDHVCLMRSDLGPRGARYTELAALPLGPPV